MKNELEGKKMLGYVRVSTGEQAEVGQSMENQERRIKAFCDMWDIDLLEIVVDPGRTGDNLKRPGLQKVLKKLDDGDAEGVIIYALDRISRRSLHIFEIIDKYFQDNILCSLSEKIDTTSAIGQLMIGIFASMAQYERARLIERIKSVLDMKKEKGERLGTTPLGFKTVYKDPENKKGGELVPVLEELSLLKEIVDNRAAGWSYAAICDNLNNRGINPKRGKKWWPSSLKHLVESEKTKERLTLLKELQKEDEAEEKEIIEESFNSEEES